MSLTLVMIRASCRQRFRTITHDLEMTGRSLARPLHSSPTDPVPAPRRRDSSVAGAYVRSAIRSRSAQSFGSGTKRVKPGGRQLSPCRVEIVTSVASGTSKAARPRISSSPTPSVNDANPSQATEKPEFVNLAAEAANGKSSAGLATPSRTIALVAIEPAKSDNATPVCNGHSLPLDDFQGMESWSGRPGSGESVASRHSNAASAAQPSIPNEHSQRTARPASFETPQEWPPPRAALKAIASISESDRLTMPREIRCRVVDRPMCPSRT